MKLSHLLLVIIFSLSCSNSQPTSTEENIVNSYESNNYSLGGSSYGGQNELGFGGSLNIGGINEIISIGGSVIETYGGATNGIAGMAGTTNPILSVGGSETMDPPIGDTSDPPPGDTSDPPPGDTLDPPPGDTLDPPPGDTLDPPGDTVDPPGECIPSEMDNVNVIVFKDASPSGADSEGRMYVGGDLTAEGYGIASKDNLPCTSDDFSLVVGGDLILTGGSVGDGRIAYGGEATLSNFTAPCGTWKYPDSIEPPVNFVELEASFKGYSIAFTQYPINGTVSGALTLTGTDPALNVFSITAEQLMNANQIKFVSPDTSSIIVNVSGDTIDWSGAGFILPDGGNSCRGGTSDWCHRILWNMYEATLLNLSGIGVQGSILAPYATLDGGGGNVDGQVIVEYLFGGIEYHPYFFNGCLELPMEVI
jgi:choice-of-anchor A domain-containing protein